MRATSYPTYLARSAHRKETRFVGHVVESVAIDAAGVEYSSDARGVCALYTRSKVSVLVLRPRTGSVFVVMQRFALTA